VLAERGGRAVGFALYFFTFSTFRGRPTLYLEDLFVRPEERGRGVGRRLLVHLARIAVSRDCGRMEWSVLDWNTPARDFYFKLGAAAMDEWTVFRMTPEAFGRLAREDEAAGLVPEAI
jgi:GNAT superfamily N-acetyltransferase